MMILEKEELVGCVCNSVNCREDEEGFLSFLRFTDRQLDVYGKNPLFRVMSLCSSGVCLSFDTNGDEITVTCKAIELSKKLLVDIKGEMTLGQILHQLGNTIKKVNQAGSRLDILQHLDLYINNHYQSSVRLGSGELVFCFPNAGHDWVNVKIWLPIYKPMSIGYLSVNGEFRPSSDTRPLMLSFGDSITQGFIAGKPSFCYVAQLAELLEVFALNQGIGGCLYHPDILTDAENLPAPDLITVAYGINDWHQDPSFDSIREHITGFYARLHELYPQVPTYVLTPIWCDDMLTPQPCGSFADVTGLILEIAGQYSQIRIIDGVGISPHNPSCYSDGWLHPNISGFSYMAPRIYRAMAGWRKV